MSLEKLYQDLFGLSDERLIRRLTELGEGRHVKKGHLLYREGEVPSKLTFLLQGLLRGYFLDAGGRDISDCFAFKPGAPATACIALGEPATISIEALTDSQVLELPMGPVLELMEEYPQLYRLYTDFLLEALKCHWEVKAAMYQYTAMERYQWFLRSYPGLCHQVSGKHIASFLGMTQVTLSRLRRAMREAGQLQAAEGES